MRADPWAPVLLALLLITLPLPWVAAAILAAAVHEGGHWCAVRLLGGKTQSLWVGLRGARMEAVLPSPRRELLAILAGPAASLSLLLLIRVFPRLSLCGLVQGVFNLLPIVPLDGGRALRLLLRRQSFSPP